MKNLFKALEDKFPGCEVVDVRFTVSNEPSTLSVEQLDVLLADAIVKAEEMDISTISSK